MPQLEAPGAAGEIAAVQGAGAQAVLPAVARNRPFLSRLILVAVDFIALAAAGALSVWIRKEYNPQLDVELYAELLPALALFIGAFFIQRLYTLVGLSAAEELRRGTMVITLVYLAIAAATFMFRGGEAYSRGAFVSAWALSVLFVPAGRVLVRRTCASRDWWGHPVMILGAGLTGAMVVRSLKANRWIGLRPVAVFDDDPKKHGNLLGVPVAGGLEQAAILARQAEFSYVIVAMPGVEHAQLLKIVEKYAHMFSHLIIVPDLFGFASLRVPAKDLGGVLGLEIRQQLLLPIPRFTKRTFDLISSLLGLLALSWFFVLLALAIRLESAGPAFYGHLRIGRRGRKFKAWKFRTMVCNADKILHEYLAAHPELKEEWEKTQKLKKDPRVTFIGRILRKTSLDELPQLWNVLWGRMSLVGPRPIVEEEVARYGEAFELYLKVRPGMTGLWQVSGRNDTTYAERVALDTYYVRNWSMWQDIVILAQTLPVVMGKGAY